MPRSKQGERDEQSPTKRYFYSRRQRCLPPRYFRAPTTIGKIARNLTKRGKIGRRPKKAHAKACIKAQANEGTVKFGAANSAAHLETTQNVENNPGVDNGGMKVGGPYQTKLDFG